MLIYKIEQDTISKDVFYLGYQGAYYFASRLASNNQYLWFKEFAIVPVTYSLMYSQTYDKVYFTIMSTFTLVMLNSTTGSHIESFMIGEAKQDSQVLSCGLSNDESAIF